MMCPAIRRKSYVVLAMIISLLSLFAFLASFMLFAHDSFMAPSMMHLTPAAAALLEAEESDQQQQQQLQDGSSTVLLPSNLSSRNFPSRLQLDYPLQAVSQITEASYPARISLQSLGRPGASAAAATAATAAAEAPKGCDPDTAKLKVFMYDLPAEFHYGIISPERFPTRKPTGSSSSSLSSSSLSSLPSSLSSWPKNLSDIPSYPGGLYQQHSPEFWLTNDLLTSTMADRRNPCTAFRVGSWQAADVIFVPFFASLSYNRYNSGSKTAELKRKNAELQQELERFLKRQPAWRASGGVDHVIVIHHPNSMDRMRHVLHRALFVVADFGRYSSHVANIEKDVVAPYKHVLPSYLDDRSSFEDRNTLLFFQGAIFRKEGGIIRQKLWEVLRQEPGVHFEAGNTQRDGFRSATAGMRASKFCLHLAGDTPSSNRLFDAIASHCVPVIISDDIELPFEEELDYTEFCLFMKAKDALQKGFLVELLRSVEKAEWTRMWKRLQQVLLHFTYQHPAQPNDAVHMVWKSISHKVPSIKFSLHKRNHFARSKKPMLLLPGGGLG